MNVNRQGHTRKNSYVKFYFNHCNYEKDRTIATYLFRSIYMVRIAVRRL